MRNFWLLVTHCWTHFDEYVAIYMLRTLGGEKLPGITEAQLTYDDAGGEPPACIGHKKYTDTGVIAVGTWGRNYGPFDEHSNDTQARAHMECAASLVMRFLGLQDMERIARLVEYAKKIDLKGGADPNSVPAVVKLLNSLYPHEPQKALLWALTAIEAWYKSDTTDVNFDINVIAALLPGNIADRWLKIATDALEESKKIFHQAIDEIRQHGKILKVQGPYGMIDVLIIESDNPQAGNAGISWKKAGVVVQRNDKGQISIRTRRALNLKLINLARIINVMEQLASGKGIVVSDFKQLGQEGSIPGGRWHYVKGMEAMLNGSLSAPNTTPTRLTLEQVIEAITIALNPEGFCVGCSGHQCSSTLRNPCDWYKYGLPQCKHLRFKKHEKAARVPERKAGKKDVKTQQRAERPPVVDTRWSALSALKT